MRSSVYDVKTMAREFLDITMGGEKGAADNATMSEAGLLYQESYQRFWELLASGEASRAYLPLLIKEVFRLRVRARFLRVCVSRCRRGGRRAWERKGRCREQRRVLGGKSFPRGCTLCVPEPSPCASAAQAVIAIVANVWWVCGDGMQGVAGCGVEGVFGWAHVRLHGLSLLLTRVPPPSAGVVGVHDVRRSPSTSCPQTTRGI